MLPGGCKVARFLKAKVYGFLIGFSGDAPGDAAKRWSGRFFGKWFSVFINGLRCIWYGAARLGLGW